MYLIGLLWWLKESVLGTRCELYKCLLLYRNSLETLPTYHYISKNKPGWEIGSLLSGHHIRMLAFPQEADEEYLKPVAPHL